MTQHTQWPDDLRIVLDSLKPFASAQEMDTRASPSGPRSIAGTVSTSVGYRADVMLTDAQYAQLEALRALVGGRVRFTTPNGDQRNGVLQIPETIGVIEGQRRVAVTINLGLLG